MGDRNNHPSRISQGMKIKVNYIAGLTVTMTGHGCIPDSPPDISLDSNLE